VPLYQSQIPHELAWEEIWASQQEASS